MVVPVFEEIFTEAAITGCTVMYIVFDVAFTFNTHVAFETIVQ
jgi:hypothetical protein